MERLIGFKSIRVDNDMRWNVVELTTDKRVIREVIIPYETNGKDQKFYYSFSDNLVDLCKKYSIDMVEYCMNNV